MPVKRPGKVSDEHEAALEQADNDEIAADCGGDTACQLVHSFGNLFVIE